jgi:hypothetical protein
MKLDVRDGPGCVKGLGPPHFFCLRLENQLADYSSASYATGTEGWKLSDNQNDCGATRARQLYPLASQVSVNSEFTWTTAPWARVDSVKAQKWSEAHSSKEVLKAASSRGRR